MTVETTDSLPPAGNRTLKEGGVLFSEGDKGPSVFLIKSGTVMISTGKTSRPVEAGCVIGEDAILGQEYSYSAIAATDVALDEYAGKFNNPIYVGLAKLHLNAWEDRQFVQSANLKTRLLDFLLLLSKDGKKAEGGWIEVEIPAHAEIAETIGSKRSAVSRYLTHAYAGAKPAEGKPRVVLVHPEKLRKQRLKMTG